MTDGPNGGDVHDDVARRIEDADTLSDLGVVVPREVLEAARGEIEIPSDESDEG